MCPLDQNSKEILGHHGDLNGGNHPKPEKGHQRAVARNSGKSGKNPLRIGHGGQPGTRNK